MTRPGLVLVHGGSHAGDCWTPTVTELQRIAPDVPVLPVDLPGRGREPGDLTTLTIAQCVDSVERQIDDAGIDRVVLVGHSLAGITVPGVAARLGAERLVRTVFLSCCIPPEGKRVVDTLNGALRYFATKRARAGGISRPFPSAIAKHFFCNGMCREQRDYALRRLCNDAASVTIEPVRRTMPAGPTTWILPSRDRALPPAKQRRFIDNLGGVDEIVELDTCHDAMISAPRELAALLVARVPG